MFAMISVLITAIWIAMPARTNERNARLAGQGARHRNPGIPRFWPSGTRPRRRGNRAGHYSFTA